MLIDNDWEILLKKEFKKDYFINLMNFINNEYMTKSILPPKENIFNALNLTSYKDVSVVILGQNLFLQIRGYLYLSLLKTFIRN